MQEVSPTVYHFYSCFRAEDALQKKENCFVLNSPAPHNVFSPRVHGRALPLPIGTGSVRGGFSLAHLKFGDQRLLFFSPDSASNPGSSPSGAFPVVHQHGNSFLCLKFARGAGEGCSSEINPVPRKEKISTVCLTMLHPVCHRRCTLGISRIWLFFFSSKWGCKLSWTHHGHCWALTFPGRLEKNRIFCLSLSSEVIHKEGLKLGRDT